MQTLDYLRCSSCQRILAEQVRVGGIGSITITCWGCGEMIHLPEESDSGTFLVPAILADIEPDFIAGKPFPVANVKPIPPVVSPKKGKP